MRYRFFPKGFNGCVVEYTTPNGERFYNEFNCSVEQAKEKVANEQRLIARAEEAARSARKTVFNNYFEATKGRGAA